MRRIALMIVILVLLCRVTFVLSEIPANVQAVMDKGANGVQLTPVEKEILFEYSDAMNIRTEWGLDTEWGPDGWGYTAKDPASGGDPYSWIDITSTGTEIWASTIADDDLTGAIPLGFSFQFYDSTFDSVYICANIIIQFTDDYIYYYDPIPSSSYAYRVDPWVYDMYHVADTSRFYYQSFADNPADVDTFVVSFIDARYYTSTYRNNPAYGKTLQVILFSDGGIKFQYNSLQSIVGGSPYDSGIDDDYGSYGLSCGSSFSDGYAVSFYPPPPGIYLSDPMVTPASGNDLTDFYFYVTYRHTEGTAPMDRSLWVDGSLYSMNDPSGNYAAGVTMDYGPVNLTVGTHNYNFYFDDGSGYSAYSPPTGTHSGPTVYQSLSGPYDIGGGNNDYQNLVEAATAIQYGGLSGPVVFYIYGGVYDGQVNLPGTISGLSSTNTLTWQNATGESPVTTSSTGYGFYLTGADYVTIKGLEIRDCYYNGIYNYYSGSDYSTHNRYLYNYIHDVGTAGDYYAGIYLTYADSCDVIGNEIDGDYYGVYNNYGDRNRVINNMIYNTGYYGIYAYYGNDNEYYYNSVLTGYYYTMYKYYGNNITVKNNIFYNTNTSGYAYAIYGTISSYPLVSDYNDIYAPNGASVGYYNYTSYSTLPTFQAATGQDANSISEDPNFISTDTPDLHIMVILPSPVDSAGTPITGLDYDIDGDTRDPVTPDIGADEFTYQPLDYCVDLTPDLQNAISDPGDTVDYQITIENCGTLNDSYNLSVNVTGSMWLHEIRDATGTSIISSISVNAGIIDSFMVRVYADPGAAVGDTALCEVTAQSQNTPRNIYADVSNLVTSISPYTQIPFDWVEINPARPGALPGTNTGINADDIIVGPFAMGFDFPYYECIVYNQMKISSNGWMTFNTSETGSHNTNDPIPHTDTPNLTIAPYWDDLRPATFGTSTYHGEIYYYYDAANSRFIVEYDSVSHYGSSYLPNEFTFEAIFYENGTIEYMYKVINPGTIPVFPSASVGCENIDGTQGIQCTYDGSGPLEPMSNMGIQIYPVCVPTYGSVSGTITLDGAVGDITNVVVEEDGLLHRTTNPDITGLYMLDSVLTGTREITASLPGFFYSNSVPGVVVVENDTTDSVDMTLRRLEPIIPTGLACDVEFSTGYNTLTWDPHPDGSVDLFYLQWMPQGGSWADLDSLPASVQTYVDTLPAWDTYLYRIAVSDTNVTPPPSMSDWSDPVPVTWGPLPPHSLSANGFYDDRIRLEWLAPGYALPPTILVVDDDGSVNNGGTYQDVENAFFNALTDAGYAYDTFIVDWTTTSPPQDGPTAAEMADYDVVIWFTGETWGFYGDDTITPTDEANLTTYLNSGGALFLSAQDYLWDRYPAAGSLSPGQFPNDYLSVTYTTQDLYWPPTTAVGGTGSVAEGMSFTCTVPYPSATLWCDSIAHNGTTVLLADDGAIGPGASSCQYDGGSFKTIFTTLSFEGLTDGSAPSTKAQLMDNIISWLTGSRGTDMVSAPPRPSTTPSFSYNPAARNASELPIAKDQVHLFSPAQNTWLSSLDLGRVIRNTQNVREWVYETDQTIDYFRIYRDGSLHDSTSALEYFDIGLAENIDHDYYVTAWYDVGVESDPSDTVTERCNMAPMTPSNFTGAPSGIDMILTWDDPMMNADSSACVDLTTLKVYRDGGYLADVAPGVETYIDIPPTITDYYTWTIEAQDEVPNVSASAEFVGVIARITLPYFENFDTHDGYYLSSGTGCWEWGDPTYASGPATCYSEPNCWGVVLASTYPNYACCQLQTLPIELDPLATLTFYHWYSTESGYDGGNVKISTDNGSTWNLLTPVGNYPDTCYTYATGNCLAGEPVYSGSGTTWTIAEFDLSAYGGTTAIIRWTFGSDGSVTYPGWYIDNVSITIPEDYCVDLTPETMYGGGNVGDTLDYLVDIENCGLLDDAYDLYLSVTGQAWAHQIMDATGSTVITEIAVDSGSTDVFMVRAIIDPGAGIGDSSICRVYAESQNGTLDNTLIDSITITTEVLPFYEIPYDWVEINPGRPGGLPGTNTGITGDDEILGPFALGFDFPFYECVLYNQIKVASNGFATFDITETSSHFTNEPIPDASTPNLTIAPYWDDMNVTVYGTIWYYYDVTNSRFIVEWDSCAHYSSTGDYGAYSYELILYPSGDVDYQYKELTHGDTLSATVGYENADGTEGIQVTYNGSGPINPVAGMGIRITTRCDLPPPPVEVVIFLVPTDPEMVSAVLDWDPVPDAAQYKIYKSYTSPTSGYTLVDSTTLTQWTDASVVAGAPKCFYYVTADDVARDHVGAAAGGTFPRASMRHLFRPTHVEDSNAIKK